MAVCPFAVWRPVPSHSGRMSAHRGLVLHVQVGNNSCYGEFSNPANQASSTWWVSKAGVLEQYVDSDLMAWTEAAGNGEWDSVETEGVPGEALTDAQVATLARLYAWGHDAHGWPYQVTDDVYGSGFAWHGMGGVAWGNHPDCPGELRKAQRPAILALAQGTPNPKPAVPVRPPHNRGESGQMNVVHGPDGFYHAVIIVPDKTVKHVYAANLEDVLKWSDKAQVDDFGGEATAVVYNDWSDDGKWYVVAIVGAGGRVYYRVWADGKWSGWSAPGATVYVPEAAAGPQGPEGPAGKDAAAVSGDPYDDGWIHTRFSGLAAASAGS